MIKKFLFSAVAVITVVACSPAKAEPYDEERKQLLLEQMNENQCWELGCHFDELFAQYEGDIAYAGTLTGYAAVTYGNTDNLPPCAGQNE